MCARQEFAQTNSWREACVAVTLAVCVSRETRFLYLCRGGDFHPPVIAGAFALGGNAGVLGKEEVDDASFRRVHGRHFHGPPFADGAAGRSVGHALDRLDAALTVALRI